MSNQVLATPSPELAEVTRSNACLVSRAILPTHCHQAPDHTI